MSTTLAQFVMPAKALKSIANAAKLIHEDVTIDFGGPTGDVISFWSMDHGEECAVRGSYVCEPDSHDGEESVLTRIPTGKLVEVAGVYAPKDEIHVQIVEDAGALTLAVSRVGGAPDTRIITMLDVVDGDVAYTPSQDFQAGATIDGKTVGKILTSFKKNTDTMNVEIDEGKIILGYETRSGSDTWSAEVPTSEDGSGVFSVALIQPALKAAVAVNPACTMQLLEDGPVCFTASTDGLTLKSYATRSHRM